MQAFPTATLHFDAPIADPVGNSMLHGWLVPNPGHHYTDVRVRAGAAIFPGIHGIPRRDLADYFKSPRPYLLAGFSVKLDLPAGSHQLIFEGCTIEGHWTPLATLEREITFPAAPALDPDARAPLNADAFGEALRVLLRRLTPNSPTLPAAINAIITETPDHRHLQHPPRPFHGHLDQPQPWSHTLFGRLPITGWIFHESLPIKRVLATTDLQAVQELSYGRGTPFLRERAGAPAHALQAGYDGFLDLPAQLPLPVTVRLYAELADGSWHLGSVTHFTATDQEFAKQSFPAFSPLLFFRAWRGLAAAVRARGWELPRGREYRHALRSVWRDYRTNAPSARAAWSSPSLPGRLQRIHLFSHNLSREGAPLFLLEYARYLHAQPGITLVVTSAQEGPLRQDFEALGASVQVVAASALLTAKTSARLHAVLDELAASVPVAAADLIVANTLSAWWAVHLAHRAARPVLFYIHESTSPRLFFAPCHNPLLAPLAEAAFSQATRVSFLTTTTARYYTGLTRPDNTCITPGWINLDAIDQFRAAHPRAQLRQQMGLTPPRRLVINVGTVCERKGQHVFARAVDLLWQTCPAIAASADFLMIGARDTAYDRDLATFIAQLGRPNLRLVPETESVYARYGAADLFVCSSYEESFPRVILEAMAFSLPIVSTSVHGIPEIVRPEREALLVPPGDTAALAAALGRALDGTVDTALLAQAARARVATFASSQLLPRHLALAHATAGIHAAVTQS